MAAEQRRGWNSLEEKQAAVQFCTNAEEAGWSPYEPSEECKHQLRPSSEFRPYVLRVQGTDRAGALWRWAAIQLARRFTQGNVRDLNFGHSSSWMSGGYLHVHCWLGREFGLIFDAVSPRRGHALMEEWHCHEMQPVMDRMMAIGKQGLMTEEQLFRDFDPALSYAAADALSGICDPEEDLKKYRSALFKSYWGQIPKFERTEDLGRRIWERVLEEVPDEPLSMLAMHQLSGQSEGAGYFKDGAVHINPWDARDQIKKARLTPPVPIPEPALTNSEEPHADADTLDALDAVEQAEEIAEILGAEGVRPEVGAISEALEALREVEREGRKRLAVRLYGLLRARGSGRAPYGAARRLADALDLTVEEIRSAERRAT